MWLGEFVNIIFDQIRLVIEYFFYMTYYIILLMSKWVFNYIFYLYFYFVLQLDGKSEIFSLSKWLVLVVAFHSRKVKWWEHLLNFFLPFSIGLLYLFSLSLIICYFIILFLDFAYCKYSTYNNLILDLVIYCVIGYFPINIWIAKQRIHILIICINYVI